METEDGVVVEAQNTETKTFSKNKIIALGVIAAGLIFIGGLFIGISYQISDSQESVATETENLAVESMESVNESGSDQSTWALPQKDQNIWALPQKMLEEMIPFDQYQQVGDFVYSGYERLDGTSYYALTFTGTTTLIGKVNGFVDQYTSEFNYYASNYYTFYPDEQSLLKLPTLQIPNESSAVVYDPTDGLWFKELYLYPDAREHLRSVIDSRWCNDRITVNCISSPVEYTGEDFKIGITEYKLYVCISSCDNFKEKLMFTADPFDRGSIRTHYFGEIDLTHLKNQISLTSQIKYFSNTRSTAERQIGETEVVFLNLEDAYDSNLVPFYSLVAETDDYFVLSINCFKETACGDSGLYKVDKQTKRFSEMSESERYSTMWTAPAVSPDNKKIVVVSGDGLEIGYIDISSDTYSKLSELSSGGGQAYLSFGMGNSGSYQWIDDRTFDVQIYSSEQLGSPLEKQQITIPD